MGQQVVKRLFKRVYSFNFISRAKLGGSAGVKYFDLNRSFYFDYEHPQSTFLKLEISCRDKYW